MDIQPGQSSSSNGIDRRKFIAATAKAAGSAILLNSSLTAFAGEDATKNQRYEKDDPTLQLTRRKPSLHRINWHGTKNR